jgi:hypothetical protein
MKDKYQINSAYLFSNNGEYWTYAKLLAYYPAQDKPFVTTSETSTGLDIRFKSIRAVPVGDVLGTIEVPLVDKHAYRFNSGENIGLIGVYLKKGHSLWLSQARFYNCSQCTEIEELT